MIDSGYYLIIRLHYYVYYFVFLWEVEMDYDDDFLLNLLNYLVEKNIGVNIIIIIILISKWQITVG